MDKDGEKKLAEHIPTLNLLPFQFFNPQLSKSEWLARDGYLKTRIKWHEIFNDDSLHDLK